MFPILVKIGPFTIHTYGFMMALGVAFGLWFLFTQAKRYDLNASKLVDMAFYTIIIALIGAKAILLIGNFSYYTKYPKELFSLARSGGVFQGGGPALALGHGFGRIGCFSAGCCYGRECTMPWGVNFHNEYSHELTGITQGIPLHPTQLYEALLNFLNFGVLFFVLKRKKFDGQIFSLYIINYSIIRYIVEFYRGDHPDAYLIHNASSYLSVSYPQVFCILGLIGGLLLFFVLKKKKAV
jgi:phosphatidylglycerol:prolipoprotein diacylglycerol transferase